MSAAVETMAYAQTEGTPWHRLGTPIDSYMTSKEAIVLSGLGWEVEKRALVDLQGNPADDMGMYRMTDNAYLGTVTPGYNPWQNWEAFEFMDGLLQDGILKYSTAGSLDNGRKIWLLAKLEEDMRVADEVHEMYMLLITGHDGKYAVHMTPTDVRVVCQNTANMAIGQKTFLTMTDDGNTGGAVSLRIKHNNSMKANLDNAQQALRITTNASRAMQEWMEKAATTDFGAVSERVMLDELFGERDDEDTSALAKVQRGQFVGQYLDAEYDRNGENVYSAFNAITGWADHGLRYNNSKAPTPESQRIIAPKDERRFMGSLVNGRGVQFKKSGLAVLSELV